jgi:hypothetical protein
MYTWKTSGSLMADTVVVPRLRTILAERQLPLDELHRRLVARGDAPSRATLGRLAQDKPVQTIRVESVVPILEELSLPLDALFEVISRADWERRQTANGQAHAAAGALARRRGSRRNRIAEAEAETDALIARLERDLRTQSPELFDNRGRLRKRALVSQLTERFGSTTVERDEIVARIDAARAARSGDRAS